MADRIDYRYNAEERIKVAVTHPDEVQAQTTALIAQAEATLALVEQQRIANLIAVRGGQSFVEVRSEGKSWNDVYREADAAIREGLGL